MNDKLPWDGTSLHVSDGLTVEAQEMERPVLGCRWEARLYVGKHGTDGSMQLAIASDEDEARKRAEEWVRELHGDLGRML